MMCGHIGNYRPISKRPGRACQPELWFEPSPGQSSDRLGRQTGKSHSPTFEIFFPLQSKAQTARSTPSPTRILCYPEQQ